MTIIRASENLVLTLKNIYREREAKNIAALIIENITGLTKTQILINKQLEFTSRQQQQLELFTSELMKFKPVQYVLHEAWFAGLKFYVDENVLIPRPETEELVETVLASIKIDNPVVLDIGTGSGCIAISLKNKLSVSDVYAMDISEEALKIANKNALENKTDIHFLSNDILNPGFISGLPYFDVIVSNPPYIQSSESREMEPNVLLYEPHTALFVPGNDALLFYRAIADFGKIFLKPETGKLFFEVNEIQGGSVVDLLKEKGYSNVDIKKDLQGKGRIVHGDLRFRL